MRFPLLPLLAALLVTMAVRAETQVQPAAAGGSDAAAAAVQAPSADEQLEALVSRLRAKLGSGARTEEQLTAELKEFDAFIAAHRGEKSDVAPKAAYLRALLYLQVFKNLDAAAEQLKAIQADYPDSPASAHAKQMLETIAARKDAEAMQAKLQSGAVFPEFSGTTLAGDSLALSRHRGKVVLVDFWATWCPPCVAEVPAVVAAYEKYHAKGFEIVGISLDQDESKLKTFIAERKMPWAQLYDGKGWEGSLVRQFGVRSIPATYLLDAEGKIVARDLRGADLENQLERLLGK